ncbi:MAG: DUF945 family protein [Burkholderiaceae bacterium]
MKIKTVGLATAGLAVIAFAGATSYSSKVTNQALDEIAIQTAEGKGLISLQAIERNASFARSSGVFDLALDTSCLVGDAELPELPAQIRYTVAHMPTMAGLTAYTATLELTGEAKEAFEAIAGQSALLELEGEMGFTGQWAHRSFTPEINFDQDGLQVTVSASEGEFQAARSGQAGAFAWRMPAITMAQAGNTLEFAGITATGVIDDMQLGLGKQTIAVDRVDLSGDVPGGTALMSGVRFDYETVASDGRVSTSFQPSVNMVRAVDNTFQDLAVKMEVGGIDEQSLREINQLTRHQCQAKMDEAQIAQIEQAILRIIDRGLSFSISDFKGRQLENSFGGELILTLKDRGNGTDGPVMAMRERLEVSGELAVSPALVPAQLLDMLVEQNYLQPNGAVMETSLALSDGQLLINGAPDTHGYGDSIDFFMVMAEDGMSTWHDQIASGNGPLVMLARSAR